MSTEEFKRRETVWITWMIVLTLIVIFIPQSLVTSIANSLSFISNPFKYIGRNFTGMDGLIRLLAIVVIDGFGTGRCVTLHAKIKDTTK